MNEGLHPLRIGRISVDFPVVLASLAGYSDLPYRLICRSFSAPYATTEAMLDSHLLIDGKLREKLVRLEAADHPVAAQIMGSDPAVMASAASVLSEMGFDVIDLNFACPVKKVLARRRGGHLMRDPDRAIAIVQAVMNAIHDKPVTLKLRRAFREDDETSEAFWTIARQAFAAGVAAICVHARSVEQKYRGRADWDFITRVKQEFPERTIIGSGDIHTAADALRMIRETGVDGVTAARGAIGNPWLFRQARDLAAGRSVHDPTLEEQHEVIERHFGLASRFYGPARGLKIIRNFGLHYARMHPRPGEVRAAVLAVKTEEDWRAFLAACYG